VCYSIFLNIRVKGLFPMKKKNQAPTGAVANHFVGSAVETPAVAEAAPSVIEAMPTVKKKKSAPQPEAAPVQESEKSEPAADASEPEKTEEIAPEAPAAETQES
jgi:hypothetical protein